VAKSVSSTEVGAASVAPLKGPQTSPVKNNAPTTFTVFKDNAIPSACSSSCAQSTVNEPDTANSGKYIVQTSNWDIAYTSNGGAGTPTWSYQNPYSLQSGFCCDQTVTYVPSRDRFVYEGLTLGSGSTQGITIATTRSASPTSWCVYHFDGSSFGGTAGDLLDYPKIAYSNNDLYLTWNNYNSSGSWVNTGLARLPIDPLASCAGFSYNYITRTDNFTFGQTVYLSPLYAAARSVAGVTAVATTTFQPQGVATSQYLDAGEIKLAALQIARLDNDRNFPDHGQLTLLMEGGK